MKKQRLFTVLFVMLLVAACYPSTSFDLDEPFQLDYQESKRNREENLRLRFDGVLSDDRCPIEHNCLLPGNASVSLTLWQGFTRQTLVLNTYDAPRTAVALGYAVTLTALTPQRSLTEPPAPEAYAVTVVVGRAGSTCDDNADCASNAADRYCRKEEGQCSGVGQCAAKPDACVEVEDPVCGCDGNTYGNACKAAAAGINVAHEGQCDPEYCWGNEMCAADEFCHFSECAQETGSCRPRPEACPTDWAPVCGCDGKTYSNACSAMSRGVSVDYTGACKN